MSQILCRWQYLIAILLICTPITITHAATSAIKQLRQFGNITSVQADFTQQQALSDGRLEKTSGILVLKKPGKFRWEYRTPYRQLMVSNGQQVWFYDVDLNQVIIRTLNQAIGDKPTLLLSDPTAASDHFDIKDLTISDDGLDWLEATPRQADSSFSKIRIGFKKGIPNVIVLDDLFGNQTRLQLSNVKINVPISPSQFTFVPPEGASVMQD